MAVNLFYYFLCALAAFAALGIFFTNNPLSAVLYLVCIILSLAGLYCLQGAPLIGMMQIILHAGGVVVLLVYLLYLKPAPLPPPTKKKSLYLKIAYLAILLVLLSIFGWHLSATLPSLPSSQLEPSMPSATMFSYQLMSIYWPVLELLGILLLVTLVGILYMVRKDKR